MSNAVQIGADDVLTGIDAFMDWRWFSPSLECGLNVRLDFMLFCRFRSLMHLCLIKRPIAVFAIRW
ncbi:MAG: hypothetical protein GDA36_05465 [Rhodobacteraceae bacterium]|nr:hypothetical protein [Paracoccaceae bacterium]